MRLAIKRRGGYLELVVAETGEAIAGVRNLDVRQIADYVEHFTLGGPASLVSVGLSRLEVTVSFVGIEFLKEEASVENMSDRVSEAESVIRRRLDAK